MSNPPERDMFANRKNNPKRPAKPSTPSASMDGSAESVPVPPPAAVPKPSANGQTAAATQNDAARPLSLLEQRQLLIEYLKLYEDWQLIATRPIRDKNMLVAYLLPKGEAAASPVQLEDVAKLCIDQWGDTRFYPPVSKHEPERRGWIPRWVMRIFGRG